VGTISIDGRVGETLAKEEMSVIVMRDDEVRTGPNPEVQKAFASCAILSSNDPDIILEALKAKRELYILEGRHEDDIQEIEDRIQKVESMQEDMFDLGEDSFGDVVDVGDAISIDTIGGGNGSSAGGLGDHSGTGSDSLGDDHSISNGNGSIEDEPNLDDTSDEKDTDNIL
jgi:hypothetical protein